MPRKYTPDQKTVALLQLQRNGGNIPITAAQMGIARSTLYGWQSDIQAKVQETALSVRQPAEHPEFEDDLEVLAFVRRQILDEMVKVSIDMRHQSDMTTPYQRVHILSQLMDRLMKLDEHLKPYQPPPQIKIVDYDDEPTSDPTLWLDIGSQVLGPFDLRDGLDILPLERARLYYQQTIPGCDPRITTYPTPGKFVENIDHYKQWEELNALWNTIPLPQILIDWEDGSKGLTES
ncbi:MAG: transposase [Anaerolineae bacterium]|nr:transposase [Anaerolineae bacterium]